MAKNFYDVLGVTQEATLEEISGAFKKLALENHPDKNLGDAGATTRFQELNVAQEVLKDHGRRALYDSRMGFKVHNNPQHSATHAACQDQSAATPTRTNQVSTPVSYAFQMLEIQIFTRERERRAVLRRYQDVVVKALDRLDEITQLSTNEKSNMNLQISQLEFEFNQTAENHNTSYRNRFESLKEDPVKNAVTLENWSMRLKIDMMFFDETKAELYNMKALYYGRVKDLDDAAERAGRIDNTTLITDRCAHRYDERSLREKLRRCKNCQRTHGVHYSS